MDPYEVSDSISDLPNKKRRADSSIENEKDETTPLDEIDMKSADIKMAESDQNDFFDHHVVVVKKNFSDTESILDRMTSGQQTNWKKLMTRVNEARARSGRMSFQDEQMELAAFRRRKELEYAKLVEHSKKQEKQYRNLYDYFETS